MKEIGLYFGSFNPIHIGHMIIANYFVEHTHLDEVWFIISPHNPLKKKSTLLDDRQRYYMVQLAVEDDGRFKASNIEFHLEQPSYTIHTLAALKEKYPDHAFSLLMGGDNLTTFHKWKNHEEILTNYKILVYQRPGFEGGLLAQHASVSIHHAPLMEISSSYIRKEIKAQKEVSYFLPAKVFEYISEMNLYRK
jgi:nicotinate-nucleotide adenylyltransferase